MTVNTDVIQSGGETVTGGTPWAQNILLYENNFSLTCHGQFNLRFSHDGVYSPLKSGTTTSSPTKSRRTTATTLTAPPRSPVGVAGLLRPIAGYGLPVTLFASPVLTPPALPPWPYRQPVFSGVNSMAVFAAVAGSHECRDMSASYYRVSGVAFGVS